MPRVEIRKVLAVDKDRLFQVVFRYQEYPNFISGLRSVQVERTGFSTARLTYRLSVIKDITFTLDLLEDERRGIIRWSLVESNFFEAMKGYWKVKDLGPGRCEVEYGVELESKIPIPRMIVHQLIKRTVPAILKSFEQRAQRITPVEDRSACC